MVVLHSRLECYLEFSFIRSILDLHNLGYRIDECVGGCDGFAYFIGRGLKISEDCNSLVSGYRNNELTVHGKFENLVTIIVHSILDNNGDCSYCPSSLTLEKEKK